MYIPFRGHNTFLRSSSSISPANSLGTSMTAEAVEEVTVVSLKQAVMIPVMGSVVLMMLFFFMNWLMYLLIGLISFSSITRCANYYSQLL